MTMALLHSPKNVNVMKKPPKWNSSPKSVKTYINKFQADDDVSQGKSRLASKSSPVNKEDPTNLNSILNALKISSKGSLPYPQILQTDDKSSEICDLKNVGNVTSISFIEDNSFAEIKEEENTCEPETKEDNFNVSQSKINFRLSEERTTKEEYKNEDINIFKDFKQEIINCQIYLELEMINGIQKNFLPKKDAYLEKLSNIRNRALQNLFTYRTEVQSNQELEQCRNNQLQEANMHEDDLAVNKYMDKVKERQMETLSEVKIVSLQEEERELKRKSMLVLLGEQLDTFKTILNSVQAMAENVAEESDLRKILFKELPSILEVTEQTYNKMNPIHTTENDMSIVCKRIAESIKVLQDIQNLLVEHNKQENKLKEEKLKEENLREASQQVNAGVQQHSLSSQVVRQGEDTTAFERSGNNHPVNPQINSYGPADEMPSQNRGSKLRTTFEETENRFIELKEKFNRVSEEANIARKNVHLRPLLARAVGIVNTLNNEKYDTSNRGKLQQIFNLINGRSCTIGSDTVSTSNNSSAQAFVKEQLAIRIVALSHDKQVASMGIYASLIVRLWLLYPDVGELILFKLYETCPFLVPLSIKRDLGQTDEEFNRSIGIRHKEGGVQEAVDKYLTRMGAAAQLYGRIVSIEVDNHPHGIDEGWKWMARTLSTPPQPSLTGALLSGFLSTAGISLSKNYGKQFKKMLHFLYSAYLPHIEKDILEGGHSDIVGLKSLLEEYLRNNYLPAAADGYKLLL